MRMINDEETLIKNLEAEDSNWQQIIYDATGIWVAFISRGKNKLIQLISNCGYIDLDWIGEEEEGMAPSGISEMIDYLLQEDDQLNLIKDASVNDYKKSDIFWGIYDCVILPKRTTGQRKKFNPPIKQDDGTLCFYEDDYYIENLSFEDGNIIWNYDLVEFENNFGEAAITGISLEQCICAIAADLEEVVKSINDENNTVEDSYVMFEPDFSRKRAVPSSLEELKRRFSELKIYD